MVSVPAIPLASRSIVSLLSGRQNMKRQRGDRPYVQLGTGFTFIDVDGWRGQDDHDIGFLINGGFEADFRLSRSLSLGTKMLFNGIPGGVFGENFYFSWEVAALRLRSVPPTPTRTDSWSRRSPSCP
jgi:hypothetical protein